MSGKFLAAFSNSGRYYAHISNDGKLRIWDVLSCTLKQEYTPDVHLTSPFTELQWISTSKKMTSLSSTNRKRKSTSEDGSSNEYIALGSRSGSIFIYSVSTCNIINTFKSGNNNRVNSISWCEALPDTLLSSSGDQYLIHWNIANGSVKKKWKCGKVSCIAVSPDGKSVVAAKTEINWWNIAEEKEQLLKTFSGHASDVFSLTFVQICGENCILSASVDNRFIHAWLLNDKVEERNAFCTFAMEDSLVSMSVRNTSTGALDIIACSKTGALQTYECIINGKKYTKPVKPKLSVQVGSDTDKKMETEQIPIVGAVFCDDNVAYIAYGNDIILSFEKLDLSSKESSMFLVRQDPKKKILASKEHAVNKILPSMSSKSVQYLHPESMNGFVSAPVKNSRKRTNSTTEKTVDVPLELRLENLVVNVPSTSFAPTSESLIHLLLQGLRSKDTKILHDVLLNKDDNVIRATINRLPIEAVLPLSIELISMLQGRRTESDSAIKWLKYILIIHAAHLISNPNIMEVFSPVFPLIESRLNVIGPLYRLVGRLDLMVEQIKHRSDQSKRTSQNVNVQPKLIYQDEDSEEEDENNSETYKEDVLSSNESDDHWDEMSEIDDESGQEQNQDADMENTDA